MIHAKLKDAASYRGIHPMLDRALELLYDEYLDSVPYETRYIEGEALYVTRFDYETIALEDSFFEAHRRYLDIHIMVSGEERVDISHPDGLSLFEHKDDFYAYRGEAEQSLTLKQGDFLVVFPGDAHRIKVSIGDAKPVSKVVFKLLVND